MVLPLQPTIRLTSPIQHRRPFSHLANEYLPQQQQEEGTYTTEEPTPKTRRVYGYHPGFPSSFSPRRVHPSAAVARALHAPRTGTVPADPYTP